MVILALCAIGWVLRSGGTTVFSRFLELLEDNATTVYYKNRGNFVETALTYELSMFPLGAGPGRIGMSSVYFGNPLTPADRVPLYAETQIETWVLDGGLPMLVLYPLAILLAFYSCFQIALRCPDQKLSYWAGVVFVYGVFVASACLGSVPFMSPIGVQFWAVFGALFGASDCARREKLALMATAK
jgi:hypothetical protein